MIKSFALFQLAATSLIVGFAMQVFAAPNQPPINVTGSVDANVTNNVKVINPEGGALDVRITGTEKPLDVSIQPRSSSYVLSLRAIVDEGTSVNTVTVPFDSYIAGINFFADSHNAASCHVYVLNDGNTPEGANTNLIAKAAFTADRNNLIPGTLAQSLYIPIPNMFIGEDNELSINVRISSRIDNQEGGEFCDGEALLYLIPADK